MSLSNVEVVERFFGTVGRLLQTWRPEGSLVEAARAGEMPPEAAELVAYIEPDAEWSPAFSSEVYRGLLEMARAWDDLLEAAGKYSLELLEATDLDSDRVLAV